MTANRLDISGGYQGVNCGARAGDCRRRRTSRIVFDGGHGDADVDYFRDCR